MRSWLSQGVIDNWYFDECVYNGTGSSKRYTNDAIIACHQIRQVFKLPLRQTQGFINSIFRIMNLGSGAKSTTQLAI